jgi:hypothetical protein
MHAISPNVCVRGYVIRRKLGLKTERRRKGYFIAASESSKLARLAEKYGIKSESPESANSVNSVNTTESQESAPG